MMLFGNMLEIISKNFVKYTSFAASSNEKSRFRSLDGITELNYQSVHL